MTIFRGLPALIFLCAMLTSCGGKGLFASKKDSPALNRGQQGQKPKVLADEKNLRAKVIDPVLIKDVFSAEDHFYQLNVRKMGSEIDIKIARCTFRNLKFEVGSWPDNQPAGYLMTADKMTEYTEPTSGIRRLFIPFINLNFQIACARQTDQAFTLEEVNMAVSKALELYIP